MDQGVLILIVVIVAGFGALLMYLQKSRKTESGTERAMLERLDRFQQQLEARLAGSQETIDRRVAGTEQVASELRDQMGNVKEVMGRLSRTNEDIKQFQKMLSAPSVRGGFGEVLLENLLRDILPADRYELQFTLRSGARADSVVKLLDGKSVAIDSKFPLAGYEALSRAESDGERQAGAKAFAADVKKHAKDISEKYISEAADNTLPFAFMYVPMEGVYYEIVRNAEIWNAVVSMKVYPVSPNALMPFLSTVVMGLRGMQIEKGARQIMKLLGQMQKSMDKVGEKFDGVGDHLEQARKRWEEAEHAFAGVHEKIQKIADKQETAALRPGEESKADE